MATFAFNQTDYNNLLSDPNPWEMPTSELLDGSFAFSIPSYQRGYRWESSEKDKDDKGSKQVDDLLNDLTEFALSGKENYYLQPLMVKPRLENGEYVWEVLDGQQRLTTMLLILKCLNEKFNFNKKLYSLTYANRTQLDFQSITYDPDSPDYNCPNPADNLDSYYVRKAKDRIERWYDEVVAGDAKLQRKLQELLFDQQNTNPSLRALFIWYNAAGGADNQDGGRLKDIEVFNRLNRGKICLTDSELIKALFLLALKNAGAQRTALLSRETLVRKWDEMGKKFQDDEFWKMIAPRGKEYSNRMDLLFDFIKDCERSGKSTYRFFYDQLHGLNDIETLSKLWDTAKRYFDTLCKWHEDVTKHNFIGYLVDAGKNIADLHGQNLKRLIKADLGINDANDIDSLTYQNDFKKICKILLLFNVLTCQKHGQKFPFNLYRDNSYDVEHINSQTDNPIEKIEEKREWIKEHAISCLEFDSQEKDANGNPTQTATDADALIKEGKDILLHFTDNNDTDPGNKFKDYRKKVEDYYAADPAAMDKDSIGNLTLLNSSINREYHNALFPKKLRTIKLRDQEGKYIPLCTKYTFLKYYTSSTGNPSAFSMMRWRAADQADYVNAIKETIKSIL